MATQRKISWSQYLLLLSAGLLLNGCEGEPPIAAAPPPTLVTIADVKSTTVSDTSEYVATLEGIENALIRPRVSGWVTQVFAQLGDVVREGDRLIQIDQSRQKAVLDGSVAQIETARADLEGSRAQLESQLAERSRLVSERDLNSERAALDNAKASRLAQLQEKQRLIAELNNLSEQARVADAQANLLARKQEKERLLAELALNSERSKLDDAKAALKAELATLERTQAQLKYRQIEWERYQKLYEEGVVATERYDVVTRDLRSAEADVDNRQEQVNSNQARVASAEKDLQRRVQTLEAQIATQDELIKAAAAQVESAQADLSRRVSTLNVQIATQDEVIKAADAQVEGALKNLQRRVSTLDAQIASQDKVVSAQQSKIDSLAGVVNRTQANATAEQVQLQYYDVTAPVSGVLGAVNVKVGDFVDSQTEVTSIQDNRVLEVKLNLPVSRQSQIRNGTRLRLYDAQTGEFIINSNITYIDPSAGSQTQTVFVKSQINNTNNRLRSNQRVRVQVFWEEKPGLTIPSTAVLQLGSQSFVFLAQEKLVDGQKRTIAVQQPVQLGSRQDQAIEVISGLVASDRIVTNGVVKLQNGAPITDQSRTNPSPNSSPSPSN
jgi:RND family efflux transporter MFP subunit